MKIATRLLGYMLVAASLALTACGQQGDSKNSLLLMGLGGGGNSKVWPVYKLRDTGPAGGLIFYINPNAATDGWKYLEAAPASTEWTGKVWGGCGTEVTGAEGTAIGTGKQNTIDIVSQYGAQEPYENKADYAAKICSDLVSGGYDDWFLPSKDELHLMYTNLIVYGVGGFASDWYWSSSEAGTAYIAWSQYISGGTMGGSKFTLWRVRAVRAF